MQMVGATKAFIRKPFIWNNIGLGVLGAILAIFGNGVLLYYINKSFPELQLMQQPEVLGTVFIVILGIGILITWISTHLATQRFLNLKTDRLY
jgi:cell division transport system permease protein